MGRPAADGGRCKRHPNHRQSTGICPFCLREKLAHLPHSASSATSAAYFSSTSSASSSPHSDSDLSSYAPSPRARAGSRLTKSRSLMFAVRGRRQKEDKKVSQAGKEKEEKVKKKKERFWSKLLSGSNRKQKEEEAAVVVGGDGCGRLKHSQTVKEKTSARWIK